MYGYNAEPPIAIPIYTVLPYCVICVPIDDVTDCSIPVDDVTDHDTKVVIPDTSEQL